MLPYRRNHSNAYCNKSIVTQYDCYVTIKLIVTQQELLRYYSNATTDLTCHIMYWDFLINTAGLGSLHLLSWHYLIMTQSLIELLHESIIYCYKCDVLHSNICVLFTNTRKKAIHYFFIPLIHLNPTKHTDWFLSHIKKTGDRVIGVRSPAGAKDFSSNLCVQTGSEAHPASCTMGTGGPFPGAKRGWGVTLTPHIPI
jgi:hypothetical protein